jgi:Xaa-Pro aminopeptidase
VGRVSAPVDVWSAIRADEFRGRQAGVRQATAELGCDCAVVWSRGGAFVDMHADVLYLTNHYSQQPYVGDEVGTTVGRSHAAVVIPVDAPAILVVDVPWWRSDVVVADEVREADDVPGMVADSIRGLGLGGGRIALVGTSYMSAAVYIALTEALPNVEWTRADRLVEPLRIRKSPSELEIIRASCALGNRVVETLVDGVVEGATEAEAVAEAQRVLTAGGGVLYDAACSSGPWSGQFVHARLPSADSARKFEQGDLFHVDCYGSYGGYLFDFARSRVVGDQPTAAQRGLLEGVIDGVETVCRAIAPGLRALDVFAVARRWIDAHDFIALIPGSGAYPNVGHGLGLTWEGPWLMPGDATVLEPGMHLAVEMLLRRPGVGGVMFEHEGLVTEDGFEILTTARSRWW